MGETGPAPEEGTLKRIRIRKSRPMALVAGVLVAGLFPSSAHALPAESSTGLKRPVEVTMKVSGWCDNTGSDINLVGDIKLGGVGMKITLSNNRKGTHSVEAVANTDITVRPAEGNGVFTKAPAFGGVTGNPHAVLELKDTAGNVVGTYYLGRCVTGAGSKSGWSANIAAKFGLDGGLATWVGALECSQKGSRINVKAAAWHEGIDAKLILANQVNKDPGSNGVHYAEVKAQVSMSLLPEIDHKKGWWDKEAGIHGPGGNPLVYRRFADAAGAYPGYDGKVESSWGTALGRCNKLM